MASTTGFLDLLKDTSMTTWLLLTVGTLIAGQFLAGFIFGAGSFKAGPYLAGMFYLIGFIVFSYLISMFNPKYAQHTREGFLVTFLFGLAVVGICIAIGAYLPSIATWLNMPIYSAFPMQVDFQLGSSMSVVPAP